MRKIRDFLYSSVSQVPFVLKQLAIKKELDDQYTTYLTLKKQFRNNHIKKKNVIIFSPGSGSDMLTPLLIYDAIVSTESKKISFVFQDSRDMFDGALYLLRQFASYPLTIIKQKKNIYHATFFYKKRTIELYYHVADFNSGIPIILKNGYDIYYERAFELFRSEGVESLRKSIIALNVNGYMITDAEFEFGVYQKYFRKVKDIPSKFGLYKNFQIWQKIKPILK